MDPIYLLIFCASIFIQAQILSDPKCCHYICLLKGHVSRTSSTISASDLTHMMR